MKISSVSSLQVAGFISGAGPTGQTGNRHREIWTYKCAVRILLLMLFVLSFRWPFQVLQSAARDCLTIGRWEGLFLWTYLFLRAPSMTSTVCVHILCLLQMKYEQIRALIQRCLIRNVMTRRIIVIHSKQRYRPEYIDWKSKWFLSGKYCFSNKETHFKILHIIYTVKSNLSKHLDTDSSCSFCKLAEETLVHLFLIVLFPSNFGLT